MGLHSETTIIELLGVLVSGLELTSTPQISNSSSNSLRYLAKSTSTTSNMGFSCL
ncbi:hypothetical protein VCRA2113O213_240050 [Vibrio crassostreae]|nr:hypothetical protein VCRA2113O213_240050 [Vibrio crassostreae]